MLAGCRWLLVVGAGLLVTGLGHVIFLTNERFTAASTGIASRTAIAGALGAAITFVGLIGWLSFRFRVAAGRPLFAGSVGLVSATYFIVIAALSAYWVQAYEQERTLLAAIRHDVPPLPSASTVLVDGICPYHGPAVVFESYWDLKGALALV